MTVVTTRLDFDLPPALEASEPPEARGLTRDAVRMMVAHRSTGAIDHSTFTLLASWLEPDDLVVINTSATMAAALTGVSRDGRTVVAVHLSAHLAGDEWVVEPRFPTSRGTQRWPTDRELPRELTLGEDGSRLELLGRYLGSQRLWHARLHLPGPTLNWLAVHGEAIRYGYVPRPWPLSAYQNVYATEPGSAEMPSAGRPFTPEIITRLVAKGVGVTPVVLHTGVASLEADELPYPEYFRVPPSTARRVEQTRTAGGRVVAVGTTTVRALESAFDPASRNSSVGGGVDRQGDHTRIGSARRRRHAHRVARARGFTPAHARSRRRSATARSVLSGQPRERLPVARVR